MTIPKFDDSEFSNSFLVAVLDFLNEGFSKQKLLFGDIQLTFHSKIGEYL